MKLSPKLYAQSWHDDLKVADPKEWSKISQAYLKEIYTRGETAWLSEIVRLVSQLHYRHEKIIPVTVTSARDISDAFVKEAVERVLPGKNTLITRVIDESVIGGVILETLNQRWDLTAKGQLKQFTKAISNQ